MFKFLKKFILKRMFLNKHKYVDDDDIVDKLGFNLKFLQLDLLDKSLFNLNGGNNKILSPFKTCESYSKEILNLTTNLINSRHISDNLINKQNEIIRINFYIISETGNYTDGITSLIIFKSKCEDLYKTILKITTSEKDQDRSNLFRIQYFIQQLNEHLESLIILSLRE